MLVGHMLQCPSSILRVKKTKIIVSYTFSEVLRPLYYRHINLPQLSIPVHYPNRMVAVQVRYDSGKTEVRFLVRPSI